MRVTIHDVAKAAGVSHTTVSRVINNTQNVSKRTREKIVKAISDLNYTPNAYARNLSKPRNNAIGLIVPEISNPFFGDIIKGATEVADQAGMMLFLFNTDEDVDKERSALQLIQEHRINGLIITPAVGFDSYNKEYIHMLKRMAIPIVMVDREIVGSEFDGVFFDDTKAIFDATKLLLENGHRRIAVLGGNPRLKLAVNRVNGYRLAMRSYGLSADEKDIYFGDFTKESAYENTKEILASNRYTAIVANNNMMTMGCLKAVFEQDLRIPDDIAFVGYDKIEMLTVLNSNISIVEKDVIQMGRNAMQLLIDRLSFGHVAVKHLIMIADVMERGSEKMVKKYTRGLPNEKLGSK